MDIKKQLSVAGEGAKLVAKQAERIKVANVSLPWVYRKLGEDVFKAGVLQDKLGDLFTKIQSSIEEQEKLNQAGPAAEGFGQKMKAAAISAKNMAVSKKMEYDRGGMFSELGRLAFEAHKEDLKDCFSLSPVENELAKLAALDAEIAELGSSGQSSFFNPRNVAIGLVAVAGLAVAFIGYRFVFGKSTDLIVGTWYGMEKGQKVKCIFFSKGSGNIEAPGETARSIKWKKNDDKYEVFIDDKDDAISGIIRENGSLELKSNSIPDVLILFKENQDNQAKVNRNSEASFSSGLNQFGDSLGQPSEYEKGQELGKIFAKRMYLGMTDIEVKSVIKSELGINPTKVQDRVVNGKQTLAVHYGDESNVYFLFLKNINNRDWALVSVFVDGESFIAKAR